MNTCNCYALIIRKIAIEIYTLHIENRQGISLIKLSIHMSLFTNFNLLAIINRCELNKNR
jgi:hypothetical protein